ncbi:MAG TPA: GNAT family N-acetyltransferase [Mycobacteriales bacterium]|nr:GNAT family N-acetyltransferase [Mycobacteriales bacterium]
MDDIVSLAAHADRRVAVRGGKVVAGGLSMLIPQWFGGRPVPAASLGCGCVAPEDRGEHIAGRLTDERLRPMRERGAVLATLWTASASYVRRMGWEVPTQAHSWTVPTDALRRRFDGSDFEIQHGETEQLPPLRVSLAARWNGAWQRPAWWPDWQQRRHPGLAA